MPTSIAVFSPPSAFANGMFCCFAYKSQTAPSTAAFAILFPLIGEKRGETSSGWEMSCSDKIGIKKSSMICARSEERSVGRERTTGERDEVGIRVGHVT